jgi:sec-independent protein translocase protein TatA
MMFGLGTPELILILVILVLLFGASKLPQLAKSVGTSARELRKGLNGEDDEQQTSKANAKSSKEA